MEVAVCVGCGEAKVSLAKLDQDRDKAKSHQWQRRSHETATGKQRRQCLRVEERVVPVWGCIRRNKGQFSPPSPCAAAGTAATAAKRQALMVSTVLCFQKKPCNKDWVF